MNKTFLSALVLAAGTGAMAASHNDAPLINQDPAANITDVYAWIGLGAGNKKVLNVVVTTNPLEDPGNGVNYYKFADDVLYSIHVAKPDMSGGRFSGRPHVTYNFRFSTTYRNQGTILSYGLGTEAGPILLPGDKRQNLIQRYRLTKVEDGRTTTLATDRLVPPPNVGQRTTPGYYDDRGRVIRGVSSFGQLDTYTRNTVYHVGDGLRVWAGQREDGFYGDVPAIFDFLGLRSPAKDGFSGYNLQSINMQIPVDSLVGEGESPMVGVYATTSRQAYAVRGREDAKTRERWVQVGRMGNPLFNETLVALRDKDRYNETDPTLDRAVFARYAQRCELAFLANAVLGTDFQVEGRTDLVGFFIPDLIKVDTSTGPVKIAGQSGFNRLSLFGGDLVFSPSQNKEIPAGWPNGRRLGDDVIDIALTAVASGPSYSTITPVGDNVNANDAAYNLTFPYAATPFGGPTSPLH
jgi:hypothetical protein